MGERIAGCTRDKEGWYRWHKGKTRYVARLDASEDEIMRRWVDPEAAGSTARSSILLDLIYRDALAAFTGRMSAPRHNWQAKTHGSTDAR